MSITFLEAVAREEGFHVPGSRSGRNNNPGDINWGAFARQHGATRLEIIPKGIQEAARFAYFPDVTTGFAAMKALLQVPGKFAPEIRNAAGTVVKPRRLMDGYAGATVREALYRYAPPADNNNTSAYETNVCIWVGCQPEDIIDPLVEVS